ncbi:nucleoside triphosphate pyrophosphohydrolase [bacterium]|nr:nucleoside triphosphate pyrophosphohydrolase [bacterium]
MAARSQNIGRLLRIVARLRGPGGCPWDREQTHASLRPHLIEECYEAIDALDAYVRAARRGRTAALRRRRATAFAEELGDLLLQIVLHAQLAAEADAFDFNQVAGELADKLVRRHPHVFGKHRLRTSAEVLRQWDAIKRREKNGRSLVTGLPRSLPALWQAEKIQRRVARVGFDWPRTADVVAKVEEELGELKRALAAGRRRAVAEELGDLLFAAVNLARFQGFHAEDLLQEAVQKFARRFQQVERAVRRDGRRLEECTLAELDALWERTKRASRPPRRPRPRR